MLGRKIQVETAGAKKTNQLDQFSKTGVRVRLSID
jgi:hypothetical protein